jgi:hypothetical protein
MPSSLSRAPSQLDVFYDGEALQGFDLKRVATRRPLNRVYARPLLCIQRCRVLTQTHTEPRFNPLEILISHFWQAAFGVGLAKSKASTYAGECTMAGRLCTCQHRDHSSRGIDTGQCIQVYN